MTEEGTEKPEWLKIRIRSGEEFAATAGIVKEQWAPYHLQQRNVS